MWRIAVIGSCAAACGRIDFDPLASSSNSDANLIACAGFGPWTTPHMVSELSTAGYDWGGQLTADGLTLYFQSDDTGTNHIFEARRPDRSTPWGPREELTSLGTLATAAGDPSVTGDDLEMYLEVDPGSGPCLYISKRPTKASAWTTPAPLSALCVSFASNCPYITPDGLTLYYHSFDGDTTVVSTRATRDNAFAPGVAIANLPLAHCPALSGNQLELYYESQLPTKIGMVSRPDSATPFVGPGADVPVIGSTSDEADFSISGDGLDAMFASDRPGGPGQFDLYETTRACL